MAISNRWMAAVLLAAVLAACTSPSPRARSVAPAAGAPAQLVHVTGSVIAVPIDPKTGMPQTASPMQIVSQDELFNSGHTDLASALRELVPALH